MGTLIKQTFKTTSKQQKCKVTKLDKLDFKEKERWPLRTSRSKSRQMVRSTMDSSACQTLRTASPGTILSSTSITNNTTEASTWAKSSAHQNTQPSHQSSSSKPKTVGSTPGATASACLSLTITQSHGTPSGRSTKSLLALPPSGKRLRILTEVSTAANCKECARMERPKKNALEDLLLSQEIRSSSTKNLRSSLNTLKLSESTRSQRSLPRRSKHRMRLKRSALKKSSSKSNSRRRKELKKSAWLKKLNRPSLTKRRGSRKSV